MEITGDVTLRQGPFTFDVHCMLEDTGGAPFGTFTCDQSGDATAISAGSAELTNPGGQTFAVTIVWTNDSPARSSGKRQSVSRGLLKAEGLLAAS